MEETSLRDVDVDGRDQFERRGRGLKRQFRGIAIFGTETFERNRCIYMRR
jgi:hypothetical protein